ncbi:MAG: cation:proton antiporter [Alphaproteobacteria bacterium GM202ARS2]|nr:cation:proton antiporter [Alphaproteobacteria bacterium GM202ARS2]
MHDGLVNIAIVVLIALASALAMGRLKQPPALGFILAGVVLGPSALGFVDNRETVDLLAELGVLTLLFLIGTEMPTTSFRQVWKPALSVAIGQVVLSLTITISFALIFDLPLATSIVLGFIVTLSSTAVVIKMLNTMNITASPPGQIIVGILVAQDLFFIPMMLVVGMLSQAEPGIADVLRVIFSIALMVGLLFLLQRRGRIHLPLQEATSHNRELIIVRAVAMCFGAAALSGLVGFSPAYGAFLIGIAVAHSDERQTMLNVVKPIETLLMMMFFLSIGLLIDFSYIASNWHRVLTALFIVTVLKTLLNIFLMRLVGEPWHHALIAGFLLAQIGEFSFLLSKAAEEGGLITSEKSLLIITTTALSLTITPLWLSVARYGVRLSMTMTHGWPLILKSFNRSREKSK